MKSYQQRGIVLVIVLWATVLLGVVFGSMMLITRTDIQLTRVQSNAAKAKALAEGGIYYAIALILKTSSKDLKDLNGDLGTHRFGQGTVKVRLQDEAGRVDLNKADVKLFDDLFAGAGVSDVDERQQLINRLFDWRDADDLVRVNGAEEGEYLAMDLDYGPKNAPFEVVEELLQVPGMTQELYNRVKNGLTVYSKRKEVNLDVAPSEVVDAVPGSGLEESEASPEDQGRGQGAGEAPATLERRYRGRGQGRVYTIVAEGRVADTRAQISATVSISRRARRPYTILSWYPTG